MMTVVHLKHEKAAIDARVSSEKQREERTIAKRHDPRDEVLDKTGSYGGVYITQKSTPTQHATGKRYVSYWFYGAGERNRTSDLLITNQLLYRLSYTGIGAGV